MYVCLLYAGIMEVNHGTTDPADQQTSLLIVNKMCSCELTVSEDLCQFRCCSVVINIFS